MVESVNGFNFCWTKRGIIGRIGLYFVINHPEENRKETERSPQRSGSGQGRRSRGAQGCMQLPTRASLCSLHCTGAGRGRQAIKPPLPPSLDPNLEGNFNNPFKERSDYPGGRKGCGEFYLVGR